MVVLAIDTAGPVVGVALAVDEAVAVRTERVQRGAEARLIPWAQALGAEAGIALTALDGVAVAVGPGAFTGIRVGLATAVGLSLGLGIPLWGGSSLRSRAARIEGDLPVLSLLDARKARVYAALFRGGDEIAGPGDVDPAEAVAWAQGPFVAIGEGALVYREAIEAAGGTVADDAEHPGVDALARLAIAGLGRGEGRDPGEVRPVYLREPDATPRPR